MVDLYEITVTKPYVLKRICILYIDPYSQVNSDKAPKEFYFAGEYKEDEEDTFFWCLLIYFTKLIV